MQANFHALDYKRERNVGLILAQWLDIHQSRAFKDPLFSTLMAHLAIGMPVLPGKFQYPYCEWERNDGPGLPQWLEIYQHRTSKDPLFSTLMVLMSLGLPKPPGNLSQVHGSSKDQDC